MNHCVIACRDQQKAQNTVISLKEETVNPFISSMELDLTSMESARQFAKQFSKQSLHKLQFS